MLFTKPGLGSLDHQIYFKPSICEKSVISNFRWRLLVLMTLSCLTMSYLTKNIVKHGLHVWFDCR